MKNSLLCAIFIAAVSVLPAAADTIVVGTSGLSWRDGGGEIQAKVIRSAQSVENTNGPGGSLAHRHIMATLRDANYYELGLVHPLVNDTKPAVYSERRWLDELDSVDENGCVEVPEGPGLGVEVDWDWIEDHKTGEMVYE